MLPGEREKFNRTSRGNKTSSLDLSGDSELNKAMTSALIVRVIYILSKSKAPVPASRTLSDRR